MERPLAASRNRRGARATSVLYGIAGERFIPEREIHWLAGYEASQPVRIGNAAMEQHQLDVFGEMELAFRREIDLGFVAPRAHWTLRRTLIEHLVAIWREPDEGIWEVRGGPQQFTYSKPWHGPRWIVRSVRRKNMACPLRWISGAKCAMRFSSWLLSAAQPVGWRVHSNSGRHYPGCQSVVVAADWIFAAR